MVQAQLLDLMLVQVSWVIMLAWLMVRMMDLSVFCMLEIEEVDKKLARHVKKEK